MICICGLRRLQLPAELAPRTGESLAPGMSTGAAARQFWGVSRRPGDAGELEGAMWGAPPATGQKGFDLFSSPLLLISVQRRIRRLCKCPFTAEPNHHPTDSASRVLKDIRLREIYPGYTRILSFQTHGNHVNAPQTRPSVSPGPNTIPGSRRVTPWGPHRRTGPNLRAAA
ncbi:hypothetical protein VUR80DRAFT_4504 [Thermomyces stellatus]